LTVIILADLSLTCAVPQHHVSLQWKWWTWCLLSVDDTWSNDTTL